MLQAADRPLVASHDLLVLDLDGVVYVGSRAVPGAAPALERARSAGLRLAFVTNNAARTPADVAGHLGRLGIAASATDVVTSAQAAARLVADEVEPGAAVFVIGGAGLEQALDERGLRPVTAPEEATAVVQGYGPEMPWRRVVDGAILVRAGLPWVASNTDLTIPTDRGIGPGNGTLVRLIAEYADRDPLVAGKPQRALFDETLDRVGGGRPLVVGDRLDTDIAGAARVGWPSLLVLTGVTGLPELVAASSDQRPTWLGRDLGALFEPHPAPGTGRSEDRDGPCASAVGGWRATTDNGRLSVSGHGSVEDWWRAAATAAWCHLDRVGEPVDVSSTAPPEEDESR